MRILFTGGSSFTGFWFCRALAGAGNEVVATLTRPLETYEGVRRERLEQLTKVCRLMPGIAFGTEAFQKLLNGSGPWDLFCHHAAEATNYKSPEFDVLHALGSNTLNLRPVLMTLEDGGCKAVVLTGSVFENDEGAGDEPLRAFSGYGLSKGLTWQMFRFYCGEIGLRLGKFVIPNPFGPWEEPRFTTYLMKTWKQKQKAVVKTPEYLRDNIHVDLLTMCYTRFVEDPGLVGKRDEGRAQSYLKTNPSGYVETQGAFAERVAREVRSRTGWSCELDLPKQEDFIEPLKRTNTQPAALRFPEWNETGAWDAFVEYYRR
jgi:UDP-glucose 4-epimerase